MRSRENGFVAIYVVAFFTLCATGIILIVIANSGASAARLAWLGVAALLSIVFLLLEWRRDRNAVYVFGAGMLGMCSVITVITTLSLWTIDNELSVGWSIAAFAFTTAAIAQAVFLYRLKHTPEDPRFPNAELLTSAGRTLATYVDPEDYVTSHVVIINATLLKRFRPFPRVIARASLACSLPGVGGCLIAAGPMSGVLKCASKRIRRQGSIRA